MNKHQALIEKFERIAYGDVLADDFNEVLNVSKGLHAYQEFPDLPFTDASYRAQVVLLNASLVHQFEGSCFNLGSKRFHDNFVKFDNLIASSKCLPQTPGLKEFQRYAKASLYYRIGDFMLLSIKPFPEPFDKNQLVAGLCAYSIALSHLISGNDAPEIHSAAEAFNILELKILLTINLLAVDGSPVIAKALCDNKLVSAIVSNVFPQNRDAGAFIKSDLPRHNKLVDFQKISSKRLMSEIWSIRRHGIFFKRLMWIFARLSADEDEFLSTSVTRFTEFPRSLSSVYDIQDFSLLDLKILLYRMSAYTNYLEIKPRTEQKFLYPPHFQPSMTKQFSRIWSILNTLLDTGSYTRDKTSERITFVGMLEEIRQCSFYDSDKTNLVRTGYYLWNKISRGEDLPANGRNMLVELFERYTGSILKSTHGGQAKSLFPPIGDTDESDIIFCDTANYLLAEYHLSLPDYEKASEYVSKISESGRTKEGVKTLTEKIQQRDSKNVSPADSAGSFQMIDDVKIDAVEEESELDDTFKSCNQSSFPAYNTTTSTIQQQLDRTLTNTSRIAEEIEAEVTRGFMCSILDNFIAASIKKTQGLKQNR